MKSITINQLIKIKPFVKDLETFTVTSNNKKLVQRLTKLGLFPEIVEYYKLLRLRQSFLLRCGLQYPKGTYVSECKNKLDHASNLLGFLAKEFDMQGNIKRLKTN